ncbi:MAG: helix-turn-helix transcriptional regulator [Cytophagaceae bacterium]|nr:helix-turn-helix transcriptional regulator [Gemmatimonadaceae bacterium]
MSRSATGTSKAEAAALFSALGDDTRLGLVARLCKGGPQSIARLTDESRVTRQAVTKHLLVLARAGVVRSQRQGRETRWELEPDRLEIARRYLDLMARQWTDRLDALARHLDATADNEREDR